MLMLARFLLARRRVGRRVEDHRRSPSPAGREGSPQLAFAIDQDVVSFAQRPPSRHLHASFGGREAG
jgi:hypothetical protein